MTQWKLDRREAALDSLEKGVPGCAGIVPLSEVGRQGWELLGEDLPLPAAIIRTSALRHNSAWMKAFAERENVRLAPHGKTTMSPALFDLQQQDGAWAVTVATPHQLQVARRFGYARIVMANQLVGRSATKWVVEELNRDESFDFYCLIDSAENLAQLAAIARRHALTRPLQVLVEVGFEGGRTGCRTIEQAVELARRASEQRDMIALRGVEGYEGIIQASTDEATVARVNTFLDSVVACADRCAQENLFATGDVLLSAGGSAFFDRVSDKLGKVKLNRSVVVLLRGGCYLIHDHVMFSRSFAKIAARSPGAVHHLPGLIPALEVWAYVQSRPEPGLAIATLGKRDVSFDDELPVPVKWYRPGVGQATPLPIEGDYRVSHLNDQHCYVHIPLDCPWAVGDMVGFGTSHPCLTFDKWRVLHLVDDAYRITASVRTYF